MNGKEEEKKTTVVLPKSLLRKLAQRAIELEKSQKFIVFRSVLAFLSSNIRADDHAKELFFNFQLSEDPEDRVEVPMTVELIKILHAQIHIALRKVGVNPNECEA